MAPVTERKVELFFLHTVEDLASEVGLIDRIQRQITALAIQFLGEVDGLLILRGRGVLRVLRHGVLLWLRGLPGEGLRLSHPWRIIKRYADGIWR